MKKLAFLFFVGVLFSCEKSNDSSPTPEGLNGTWELQSASCFCFFPDDFDFGAHKIDINSNDGVLTIENSSETSFIAEAGSYDFLVRSGNIVIRNTWEFTFEIKGDTLTLIFVDNPEIADDEISLTYKRLPN